MKFWKILRKLLDEIFPDWQDKFISYKALKKQLKLISPIKDSSKDLADNDEQITKRPKLRDDKAEKGDEGKVVTQEMIDFVKLLEGEITKFNGFFVEKEEYYIIRYKLLKDELAEAKEEELMKVGRKLVDFHGEMILLENYSALNYTGLLKILKKYDKRSGDLIQLPFIKKVLQEPFYRTEVINKLVKECERIIHSLFSQREVSAASEVINQKGAPDHQPVHNKPESPVEDQPKEPHEKEEHRIPEELEEIECKENMHLRLSISALRTLKELRSGSSTINRFSLPPMPE